MPPTLPLQPLYLYSLYLPTPTSAPLGWVGRHCPSQRVSCQSVGDGEAPPRDLWAQPHIPHQKSQSLDGMGTWKTFNMRNKQLVKINRNVLLHRRIGVPQ